MDLGLSSKMTELEKGIARLDLLTTKDRRQCIETLLNIFRNVKSNPDEAKYRTLKLSNKRFNDEVWRHAGARAFMIASGWVVLHDSVHLLDGIDIRRTIEVLLDNRDVKPNESEWVEENKIVGENHGRLREEKLRRKALQEKEKEIAILKKDMDERKAIAQRIISEHRHDQKYKRISKPSVAVPRGQGGKAKMSDMIPKGG